MTSPQAPATASGSQDTPSSTSSIPVHLHPTKFPSPIIAQAGQDWSQNLVRLARTAELKKHALTLQLHTAHILSAHAALESRNAAWQNVKEQKNRLESESARLLKCLREVNEDREKVNLLEASLSKECTDLRNRIQSIMDGDYAQVKDDVDKLRKELGQSPLPSIQTTLKEREGAWLAGIRRAGQVGAAVSGVGGGSSIAVTEAGPSTTSNGSKRSLPILESPDAASTSAAAVTSGPMIVMMDGEPPAKRPRGRPKGSKNKTKVTSNTGEAAVEANTITNVGDLSSVVGYNGTGY